MATKKGEQLFVDAIYESIKTMTLKEPITIPLAVLDIIRLTFELEQRACAAYGRS